MNLSDLFANDKTSADRLKYIDQLVENGLSRPRAERIIKEFYKIIDGPWTEVLKQSTVSAAVDEETRAENGFLQTLLVAYFDQWASDRMLLAAAVQSLTLHYFSGLDADKKESN